MKKWAITYNGVKACGNVCKHDVFLFSSVMTGVLLDY